MSDSEKGAPGLPVFEYPVRVQYIDTDQGGVTHHAAYFRFMEQARVEFLRARGVDYRRFEQEAKRGLPVAEVRSRYKRPTHFDDELVVETRIGIVNRAKIRFEYRILRGQEVVNEAEITCACVNLETMRICSMDPVIREAFTP